MSIAQSFCTAEVHASLRGAAPNHTLEPTRVGKPPLVAQLQR